LLQEHADSTVESYTECESKQIQLHLLFLHLVQWNQEIFMVASPQK